MVSGPALAGGRGGFRARLILPGLAAGLLICVIGSLAIGRYPVPPATVAAILLSKLVKVQPFWTGAMDLVVIKVRLPRVFAAVEAGSALAAAGAAYQGMFRNPMVSPDILGVTAGAGLGAALAILLTLDGASIQAMAFAGGLVAVAVTTLIGWWRSSPGENSLVMILAGVIVGTVFTALISLVKFVADPTNTLPAITFWLMGGLNNVRAEDVAYAAGPIAAGLAGLLAMAGHLNVLSFGDEEAQALGLQVGQLRLLIIACATLITASAVAIGGVIGLVGLVVPYLGRLLVGPDLRVLLPASMVLGAVYLLSVDDLARSLLPAEMPLGILTALMGSPVFLLLLTRTRRAWA